MPRNFARTTPRTLPKPALSAAVCALDRNQTLTQLLRQTVVAAGLMRAALAQDGHKGHELNFSHLAHAEGQPPLPGLSLSLSRLPWLAKELGTGQVRCWDLDALPKAAEAVRAYWQAAGVAAIAWLPIGQGKNRAWLLAESQTSGWPPERLAVLELVATALNQVLHCEQLRGVLRGARTELQEARQQLSELDPHDKLTGVYNRDHLIVALHQEFARAVRECWPVSLILVDIDHFADYNHHHGTSGGDYCLQQIAAVLAGAFERAGETVARWGGDSFAVLMPGLEPERAEQAAKRLLASIRARRLPHGGTHPFLTLSLGLATLRPGPSLGAAQLIELAGRALLEARETGDRLISQVLL